MTGVSRDDKIHRHLWIAEETLHLPRYSDPKLVRVTKAKNECPQCRAVVFSLLQKSVSSSPHQW